MVRIDRLQVIGMDEMAVLHAEFRGEKCCLGRMCGLMASELSGFRCHGQVVVRFGEIWSW